MDGQDDKKDDEHGPQSLVALFGARLFALRREKGWTMEKTAKRAKCTRGYYCEMENGHKAPVLKMLANLARAFGVEESDLLCFPGQTDRHDLNDLLRDAPQQVRQEVLAFARERLARYAATGTFKQPAEPQASKRASR
jgi:transcriptional regulator with XRE-family HTH domain